jgi:hypothetical protein
MTQTNPEDRNEAVGGGSEQSNKIATLSQAVRPGSLTARIAERLGIDPGFLLNALNSGVFQNKLNRPLTQAEVTSVMLLIEEHKLNPLNGELYLESDMAGRLVPTLTIDGWIRSLTNRPEYDGIEFDYSDEYVTIGSAKPCPKWIEVTIHRKDRKVPTSVREHIDEVFQGDLPGGFGNSWYTHPKRRLRHKGIAQCARLAFGFGGVYDPDEAARIIDGEVVDVSFENEIAYLDSMPLDDELKSEINKTVDGLVARYQQNSELEQSIKDLMAERWSGQALEYALETFCAKAGIEQDVEIDATDAQIDSLNKDTK